jgi:hypothetical protein
MSNDGEIVYPLDRTSLVLELDALIEQHGADTQARRLLTGRIKLPL